MTNASPTTPATGPTGNGSCWCSSAEDCRCLDELAKGPRWPAVVAIVMAVIVLAACVMLAAGCAGADPALVAASDQFVNRSVGPEYERWVAERALSADEKQDRLNNVAEFRRAVEAAKRLNGK